MGQLKFQLKFYGAPTSACVSTNELLLDTSYRRLGFESEIDALIECLLKEGIIVDREPLSIQYLNPILLDQTIQ